MRALVQRVSEASVSVGNETIATIGKGLVLLLGVGSGDDRDDLTYIVKKVSQLRIFPDLDNKMNRSVTDVGGELLVISQFTLYGDVRRGNRPSFAQAADSGHAEVLYDACLRAFRQLGIPTQGGRFGAMMSVRLVNSGPVTLLIES